jgi:hypothetical protein
MHPQGIFFYAKPRPVRKIQFPELGSLASHSCRVKRRHDPDAEKLCFSNWTRFNHVMVRFGCDILPHAIMADETQTLDFGDGYIHGSIAGLLGCRRRLVETSKRMQNVLIY